MKRLLILALFIAIGALAQDPTPVYNGPMIIRGGTTPLTVHKNTAFNGTHTQTGNAVITPLVAPGAPTVTPTPGGGGTTWGYKVVACLDALCVSHTTASVETDDVAGPADLLADGSAKETISWTGVKGALFYAVRRIAWGGTCRGAACAGGSIGITTLTNLEDTGQVGDGTATPLTNNTGNLAVGLISGNPVISDSLQVPRLGVGIAPHATHPLVVHAGTNTNLRVVDYLPGTIGVGYLNDAGTTFVDSVTQGLTQDFYTGAGAANLSALYLHSNRYAGFNTRARTGNTNPTQRADVWDGNIEVADSGTLGTESLKNGTDFAVTWVVVNDFAIAGAQAVYTDNVHDGHIYQTAANQNTPAVANRWYKFQYDVVNNSLTGTPLAWITAEYSLAIQYLDLTVGASKVVYFKSAVVPGIFRIDVSGTTGGVLTLDNFGLKEVQGGNVIVNGLITGGGTNGIRILSSGAVQLTGPALGTTYGGLGASLAAAATGTYPKSNGATPAVFAASTLAASGIGACGANTWASTLNGDAAPTCTQPSAANLSNGVQGSGAVVLATSPTITTPTITGNATINYGYLKFISEAPPAAPGIGTIASNATGPDGAGDHYYRLTCVLPGGETEAGAASLVATAPDAHDKVTITGLASLCASGTATYLNVYRTLKGGSVYYRIAANTVAYGTATYDDVADDATILALDVTAPTVNTTTSRFYRDGTLAGFLGTMDTYWGFSAGYQNTGANPTMIGVNAGSQNTGANPTMIGFNAGSQNTGANPTMIGFNAGLQNTGVNPTMIGVSAGYLNTGAYPTMIGVNAGLQNTGAYPTMIGFYAGYLNTVAYPTMIGVSAGSQNTGVYPTMIGVNAGLQNTGAYPTMIGFYAGSQNTGAYPTMTGFNAGLQNTGAYPTMIGVYAGLQNTGANPTMTGFNAGYLNTGANPTMTGFSAGYQNNWPNVTHIGARTTTAFAEDAATTKNITEASITAANTITYATHGFGTVGGKVNLIYKLTGGTPPVGLVHNTVYQFTVTSVNVLTLSGIAYPAAAFTGSLTNSVNVSGTIVVGVDAAATKANQAVLGPSSIVETVLRGAVVGPTSYSTATNCANSASPAVCAAAPAGAVVIAATATSVVVNTTAVTATSRIMVTRDDSLGTELSVTCNTQSTLVLGAPRVTARTAATSFTVSIDVAPTTNPLCLTYFVVN